MRVLGLVAPFLAVSAVCGSTMPADVVSARIEPDGRTVTVRVDACTEPGEHSVTVTEVDATVTVDVRVRDTGNDCGFEATGQLLSDLGNRRLVDAFDGNEIPLIP